MHCIKHKSVVKLGLFLSINLSCCDQVYGGILLVSSNLDNGEQAAMPPRQNHSLQPVSKLLVNGDKLLRIIVCRSPTSKFTRSAVKKEH